jgi:glycosyltransferase involved in cell wall biosynthesis
LKKKKLIIVAHTMRLGGVETSLLGLMQTLDYTMYEVDLFLYLHDGEFLEYIPKQVKVLEEQKSYASLLLPFQKGSVMVLLFKLVAKIYSSVLLRLKHIKSQNFVYLLNMHRYTHLILPKIASKEYDLAISFLTPHYTVAHKVKASKKIAWIHTDYSVYELDQVNESKMWKNFDYIASISELSSKAFIRKFEHLKNKVVLIENILPKEFVLSRSDEFIVTYKDVKNAIHLCSVGRFCYQKNFENIPEMTRLLLSKGLNVVWYIIGYGNDEDLIKSKIKEYGMEKNVKLLGKKSNPYPYIKACDLYIQPSRFEGKAVTVREAQILQKPVIITDFPSSHSQLKDGFDGVIVPMEIHKCTEAIKEVILDRALQKKLATNCSFTDYSNQNEIEKIYSLID